MRGHSRSQLVGILAAIAVPVLLATGCSHNNHRTFGTTQRFVASDVPNLGKAVGTPILAIGDSVISPAMMLVDQVEHEQQYDPDHRYTTYAGTRTVARSTDMGAFKYFALPFSALIETVLLPVTLLADTFWVLWPEYWGDENA